MNKVRGPTYTAEQCDGYEQMCYIFYDTEVKEPPAFDCKLRFDTNTPYEGEQLTFS